MPDLKIRCQNKTYKLSASSFSSFQKKVGLLLKHKINVPYYLQYKDCDGDKVMLCTKEDFMNLKELSEESNAPIKVFVVLQNLIDTNTISSGSGSPDLRHSPEKRSNKLFTQREIPNKYKSPLKMKNTTEESLSLTNTRFYDSESSIVHTIQVSQILNSNDHFKESEKENIDMVFGKTKVLDDVSINKKHPPQLFQETITQKDGDDCQDSSKKSPSFEDIDEKNPESSMTQRFKSETSYEKLDKTASNQNSLHKHLNLEGRETTQEEKNSLDLCPKFSETETFDDPEHYRPSLQFNRDLPAIIEVIKMLLKDPNLMVNDVKRNIEAIYQRSTDNNRVIETVKEENTKLEDKEEEENKDFRKNCEDGADSFDKEIKSDENHSELRQSPKRNQMEKSQQHQESDYDAKKACKNSEKKYKKKSKQGSSIKAKKRDESDFESSSSDNEECLFNIVKPGSKKNDQERNRLKITKKSPGQAQKKYSKEIESSGSEEDEKSLRVAQQERKDKLSKTLIHAEKTKDLEEKKQLSSSDDEPCHIFGLKVVEVLDPFVQESSIYQPILIRNNGSEKWEENLCLKICGKKNAEQVPLDALEPQQEQTIVLEIGENQDIDQFMSEWVIGQTDEYGNWCKKGEKIKVYINLN